MTATVDNAVADLQRANAELQRQLAESGAERDEALAERAALAEVLDTINRSPGDLAPVFDAMLEKALSLCDAAFGLLLVYDGEAFRAVATQGALPVVIDFLREPIRMTHRGAFDPLLRGETFVQVADITDDEIYRSGNRARRMLADEAGARTALWGALRRENALLGTFVIYRQEVRPFTDKQIALLQNFAAQAVIAMENARLITETREALEQQTATAEVLGVINSSPGDLGPVFDTILEKGHTLCGAVLGSLRIYDGEYMRAVAVRGHSGSAADVLRRGFRVSDLRLTKPLLDGAPFVHARDLTAFDDPLLPAGSRWAGTSLAVPLRQDDALLGMIVAAREEVHPFTDKQIALLQNFAAQAVIAMENARMLGSVRHRTG